MYFTHRSCECVGVDRNVQLRMEKAAEESKLAAQEIKAAMQETKLAMQEAKQETKEIRRRQGVRRNSGY
jgi:hypothetical protein